MGVDWVGTYQHKYKWGPPANSDHRKQPISSVSPSEGSCINVLTFHHLVTQRWNNPYSLYCLLQQMKYFAVWPIHSEGTEIICIRRKSKLLWHELFSEVFFAYWRQKTSFAYRIWWCGHLKVCMVRLLFLYAVRDEVNPLLLGQKGCHFADDIFLCIFVNEKFCILIKSSLKCVPKGPIHNNPTLV